MYINSIFDDEEDDLYIIRAIYNIKYPKYCPKDGGYANCDKVS